MWWPVHWIPALGWRQKSLNFKVNSAIQLSSDQSGILGNLSQNKNKWTNKQKNHYQNNHYLLLCSSMFTFLVLDLSLCSDATWHLIVLNHCSHFWLLPFCVYLVFSPVCQSSLAPFHLPSVDWNSLYRLCGNLPLTWLEQLMKGRIVLDSEWF